MFNEKTKELMVRVYNNQMLQDEKLGFNDDEAIKTLCQKVFGNGNVAPDPATLHNFNNLVIQVADAVAKPQIEVLLSYFADYERMDANATMKQYTIPQNSKVRFAFSATGSGVDVKRVERGKVQYVKPMFAQLGIYYEPLTKTARCVEDFRKVVSDIAEAKVRLFYEEVMKLIAGAVTSTKIPAKNVLTGTNVTIAQYNKLGSTISRRANNSQPILIADRLMIDYFSELDKTANVNIIPDVIKSELYSSLIPTKIGRTQAINIENPFVDDANAKVFFDVTKGYMLGAGASHKPFIIAEYGGLIQEQAQNTQDGRIKLLARQGLGIELVYGNAIGVITESSIAL